jgi:hypothetical protein
MFPMDVALEAVRRGMVDVLQCMVKELGLMDLKDWRDGEGLDLA